MIVEFTDKQKNKIELLKLELWYKFLEVHRQLNLIEEEASKKNKRIKKGNI